MDKYTNKIHLRQKRFPEVLSESFTVCVWIVVDSFVNIALSPLRDVGSCAEKY